MRQNQRSAQAKSVTPVSSSEQVVKDIRRATRKQYSAEEKIRIVLDGLRGEYCTGLFVSRTACNRVASPNRTFAT